MALIVSISGIRGTIGSQNHDKSLTPYEVVKFATAYGAWLKSKYQKPKIVIGRDARLSGPMIKHLVIGSLKALGIDIIDIDLATTPTTEIAVTQEKANGGIIITASHNPINWNALKLLNEQGEFLNAKDITKALEFYYNPEKIKFETVFKLGKIIKQEQYHTKHIELIKQLELVDIDAIKAAKLTVAVDCINSVGALIIPKLLQELGIQNIITINCDPNGQFAHEPEPLEKNLTELMKVVKEQGADVGFAVDPDVDRLAIVSEDGSYFGEEYTLVAVADYILQNKVGNTVSNLSSSKALQVITEKYGGKYYYSPVGEINVVEKMKEVGAIIGGEGNGGVIYPELHYGRDALVGIALFLSYMAKSGQKPSEIRAKLPHFEMVKDKLPIEGIDFESVIEKLAEDFGNKAQVITIDGLKLDFGDRWVHIRKSNTEPIVRIYAEAPTEAEAKQLVEEVKKYF